MCDGLGYRRYLALLPGDSREAAWGLDTDVTLLNHLPKRIANGDPQGSHLVPPSNGALAPVRPT